MRIEGFTVFVVIALFVSAAFAQTAPNLTQNRAPATVTQVSLVAVVLDSAGKPVLKPLTVGEGITIDLTTFTIKAVANQATHFITDFYKLATPTSTFNLSKSPFLPTLATTNVYLNGLLLAEGEDYTVTGKVVTLVASKQPTVANDIVQVKYLEQF